LLFVITAVNVVLSKPKPVVVDMSMLRLKTNLSIQG